MQKEYSAPSHAAQPCLLHVVVVELRDSQLAALFPQCCTVCSLAPMSCYFFELSALLACQINGENTGLTGVSRIWIGSLAN